MGVAFALLDAPEGGRALGHRLVEFEQVVHEDVVRSGPRPAPVRRGRANGENDEQQRTCESERETITFRLGMLDQLPFLRLKVSKGARKHCHELSRFVYFVYAPAAAAIPSAQPPASFICPLAASRSHAA